MMKRVTTTEPLVHREVSGAFAPAGRKLALEPRTDGLTPYGLTDAENAAYLEALERLHGRPTPNYFSRAEGEAMEAAGIAPTAETERAAFLEKHRDEHPLPTAFHALDPDDPSLYTGEVEDAPAAAVSSPDAPAPESPTVSSDGAVPKIRYQPPEPVVPYVRPSVLPQGTEHVRDLPASLVAALPAGTVVGSVFGNLVAYVPNQRSEGEFHEIHAGGASHQALLDNVAAYLADVSLARRR